MLVLAFALGWYVAYRKTMLYCIRRDVRLYGPRHDDFVMLQKYGSTGDIPSLLYGLGLQTDREVCTYQHCIDALRTLSGAYPGDTYEAWTNWWVTEKKEAALDWHPAFRTVSWKTIIQPDGAANGSQSFRSETNRTSSAAGPRR